MGPDPYLGAIGIFGGNFAPRGWALCNGQFVPIAQYTALFSLLGTTYGGDGRTTFALPDLRARVPLHAGTGAGLESRRLGAFGGTEANTLTVAQMPSHSHAAQANNGAVTIKVADQKGNNAGAFHGVLAKIAYENVTQNNVEVYVKESEAQFTQKNSLGGIEVTQPSINVQNTGGNQAINNLSPYLAINFCIALQGVYPSR